jgi:hypothetical protein
MPHTRIAPLTDPMALADATVALAMLDADIAAGRFGRHDRETLEAVRGQLLALLGRLAAPARRPCRGIDCRQPARPGSDFCSRSCNDERYGGSV